MKKLYCSIILLNMIVLCTRAQQLEISSDATLEISSGTSFYANGLTLIPSSTIGLSGINIEPKATLTNQTLGTTYISRTYYLGQNAPTFSGDILITYLDQELNGLDENPLKLAVYNGTQWQYLPESATSSNTNTTSATSINNLALTELAIGPANTLPLQWLGLVAKRDGTMVK